MSQNLIGCGNFNYFYLYILYCIISHYIVEYIFSFKSLKKNCSFGIFGFIPVLEKHLLIQSLYKYIGYIIFGFIFYFFLINNNKSKKSPNQKKRDNNIVGDKLIYSLKKHQIKSVNPFQLLIISFILFFQCEIYQFLYSLDFYDFDIWSFNIYFTLLFMFIFLNIKPYRHQFIPLLFIFAIDLILLFISTFINDKEGKNAYDFANDLFNNKYSSIFIIMTFICISCLSAFARVEAKVIMEKKYISPYKIIIIIGCIGFFLSLFFLVISSIYACKGNFEKKCILEKNNEKYYDNFLIYKSDLKNEDSINFWIEILIIIPLTTFGRFINFNFELLIIYYLNPIFILINDICNYGLQTLLYFPLNPESMNINKYILKLSANVVAFLGYLIYLEIIELKFYELNKNTRKCIEKRGKLDSLVIKTEENNNNENEDNNSDLSDNDRIL